MRNATRGIHPSLLVCLLTLGAIASYGAAPDAPPLVSVYFWPALPPPPGQPPQPRLEQIVVDEITKAQKQILLQDYYLTDRNVGLALASALGRGVIVQMILDQTQETDDDTQAVMLQRMGATVLSDYITGIA